MIITPDTRHVCHISVDSFYGMRTLKLFASCGGCKSPQNFNLVQILLTSSLVSMIPCLQHLHILRTARGFGSVAKKGDERDI